MIFIAIIILILEGWATIKLLSELLDLPERK